MKGDSEMKNKNILTKVLSLAGTILIWLPILFTAGISLIGFAARGFLRFDYLLPLEVFPLALAGSALLFWAAFQMEFCKKIIGWSFAAMLASLFGSQAVAVLSGLASGITETGGTAWGFIIFLIAAYWLTLILTGIAGVLLIKKILPRDNRT